MDPISAGIGLLGLTVRGSGGVWPEQVPDRPALKRLDDNVSALIEAPVHGGFAG